MSKVRILSNLLDSSNDVAVSYLDNVTPYSLPNATDTVLGGVKVGANLTITNGVLAGVNSYSLPTASTTVLGGVKVGANLSISSGVLAGAAPYSKPSSEPISYITGLQTELNTKTTPGYVDTKVADLVNSAPTTLDTLKELALALDNDPNHVTTMTNLIGTKLPLSGGAMTGAITSSSDITVGNAYISSGYSQFANLRVPNNGYFGNPSNVGMIQLQGSGQTLFNGNIAVTGTVDGIDIAARDAVLTSTTTTANAALPKAGGTMTGNLNVVHSGQAIIKADGVNQYYTGIKIRNNYSSAQPDWNLAASGGTSGWGNANGNFIIRDDTTNSTGIEIEKGAGGAVGALYIDSDSNVGIGTTAPISLLHVENGYQNLSHTYVYEANGISVEATEPMIQLMAEDSGTHGGSLLWRYGNNLHAVVANPTTNNLDFVSGVTAANGFDVHSGSQISGYRRTLSIGANGNVGIGTSVPDNKLTIAGNVTQLDGSPEYHFATSSSSHYNWRVAVQEQVSQAFEIASGTLTAGTNANSDTYTNRFVIKGDTGNVGIGTSSPASGYRLDVQGKLSLGATGGVDNTYIDQKENGNLQIINSGRTTNDGYISINKYNTSSGGTTYYRDFRVYDGKNGEILRVDGSTGNVGIGETNPDTSRLHIKDTKHSAGDVWTQVGPGNNMGITIQNDATTDNTNAVLYFKNDTDYVASIGARFTNHSTNETELRFGVTDSSGNSREKMYLKGDGKLGIGTPNPSALLDLAGAFSDTVNQNLSIEMGNRWGFRVGTSATDEDLHLDRNLSGTPAVCMTWDKLNGFVGFGESTPMKALHVSRADTDCMLILESAGTASDKQVCFAKNYGSGNETGGNYWGIGIDTSENEMQIAYDANAQPSMAGADTIMSIKSTGSVTIGGNAYGTSALTVHPPSNGQQALALVSDSTSSGAIIQTMQTPNVSLADDASITYTIPGTGSLIAIQTDYAGYQYCGALFHGNYSPSGSTTKLADPKGIFANSDTDGKICVFISGYTNNVTVKNRFGITKKVCLQFIAYSGM